MRVLIVDDSAFMRKAIARILSSDPAIEVVGQASNGVEGLRLARELNPDVVTMDIEMPQMDGLTALRRIMAECPTHVVMLSTLTTSGSSAALSALKAGASDVLAKDTDGGVVSIERISEQLLSRVRTLGAARKRRRKVNLDDSIVTGETIHAFRPGQCELLCIGSSTGGPPVLERILAGLPAPFGAAVVVAQHMPELFTRSMAERLASLCALKVMHGSNGAPVERDTILICPGGKNTQIRRSAFGRWSLSVGDEPKTMYRPSADVLLTSAAEVAGSRTVGVVLTGMGDDGGKGAAHIHDRGGVVLAQSEATCVVYGMPKAAAVVAVASLSPDGLLASLKTLAPLSAALPRKAGKAA